ncbi:hypothetical protein M422DRAFT_27843 [Sphaerobolus stellatus SS14]|nr:hypothetical protein M422DRAFT_27843 [Sphaerobolus stellatus SS14]
MSEDDYEVDQLEDDSEFEPEFDDEGKETFKIHGQLKPPRAAPWSTLDLHSHIHQGRIDLSPPYQRDVVWPASKQIGLIDSIFRNYYIPPIIFTIARDEETGMETRVCVDGKQRLTSITKFMDGKIPYRDPATKRNFWYTCAEKGSRAKRIELPEQYKKHFARKQITCVEYADLVPGTERDIFQRVQLGMSLTSAEKLQAVASPLALMIQELQVQHIHGPNGLNDHLSWEIKRGRDFQNMASLCYCCWNLPNFATPSATKLEKWLNSEAVPSENFINQVRSVLTTFIELASSEEYNQAFTQVDQRLAPVEFIFIGLLLAKMRHCSYKDMGKQALELRQYTRSQHKDIRSNERVMKSMWTFVQGVKTGEANPYRDWEGPGSEEFSSKTKTANSKKRGADTQNTTTPAKKPRASATQKARSSGVQSAGPSKQRSRAFTNKTSDVPFIS